MRFVFDLLYLVAAVAISPLMLYRMLRYKRYRAGWANRFGKIARKSPGKKCIWLHAVSLGEINAAQTVVNSLKNSFPNYEILITASTDTGFTRAVALYADNCTVSYFPLDFSFAIRRAFKNINPAICLLMELEVWPNLLDTAFKKNVPVVIVNGRISEKSFPKYKLVKPIIKNIFRKTSLILAQSDQYARRFETLGAPKEKIIIAGSLKYDTAQIADKVDGADAMALQLGLKNERLWVAGATGPDEEKIILDVYRRLIEQQQFRNLLLAIVPRKPERFNEVADLIKQCGFELMRYSELKAAAAKSKIENRKSKINYCILGDTMGDLRKFYSLATIIFVGRSLVPMGGSDMAEAAALGKCTIFGPYTFNFDQTVDDLLADNGAVQVKNSDELFKAVRMCLDKPDYAKKIAANGQNVIKKNQGATQKTIEQIKKLLSMPSL